MVRCPKCRAEVQVPAVASDSHVTPSGVSPPPAPPLPPQAMDSAPQTSAAGDLFPAIQLAPGRSPGSTRRRPSSVSGRSSRAKQSGLLVTLIACGLLLLVG